MSIFSSIFGSEHRDSYNNFWTWFQKVESSYVANEFNEVNDREKLFDELHQKLKEVNPELVFEFGPIAKLREFIISADGIKSAFDDVTGLVKAAPQSEHWSFIAFRQRKYPVLTVQMPNITIDPEKTHYTLVHNKGKIAIILFFDGLNDENKKAYTQGSYLLLDGALGEFDMETKVGFIEITSPKDENLGKYYDENNKVSEIASHFDSAYSKIGK